MEQIPDHEFAPCLARNPDLLGQAAVRCAFQDTYSKLCELDVRLQGGHIVRTTPGGVQQQACRQDAENIALSDIPDRELLRRAR